MAEQVITLYQILLILENETRLKNNESLIEDVDTLKGLLKKELYWEMADGIFAISQAELGSDKKINIVGSSIASKIFVNKKTLEMRYFVAKHTDEEETKIL